MTIDFSRYRLDAAIAEAARKAFATAIDEYPDHRFFAFALTTWGEVQDIECSVNSDRNFEEILPKEIPYSRTMTELQQQLYYKWSPNEWGRFECYGLKAQDFFAPVNALLRGIEADATAVLGWEESFCARQLYVFDMMIAALKALDDSDCFGRGRVRRGRLAFADIYDDPAESELRARSVREINGGRVPPALITEFLGLEQQ